MSRPKDLERLPTHLAIIMDGNGRWARRHNLSREKGHERGSETTRKVVTFCRKIGIPILTLYAFSLENWSRPAEEVEALMRLLHLFLKQELKALMENNIRLMAMGQLHLLPNRVRRRLLAVCRITRKNDGLILNLAISYGGRAEIVDGVKRVVEDVQRGRLNCDGIDEKTFSQYLYSPELPDPDLLIRTGGEMRISNFLLWQSAYTEICVSQKLWPDFDENDLMEALIDFQNRERRFGLTSEQIKVGRCFYPGS